MKTRNVYRIFDVEIRRYEEYEQAIEGAFEDARLSEQLTEHLSFHTYDYASEMIDFIRMTIRHANLHNGRLAVCYNYIDNSGKNIAQYLRLPF